MENGDRVFDRYMLALLVHDTHFTRQKIHGNIIESTHDITERSTGDTTDRSHDNILSDHTATLLSDHMET